MHCGIAPWWDREAGHVSQGPRFLSGAKSPGSVNSPTQGAHKLPESPRKAGRQRELAMDREGAVSVYR